MAEISLNDQFNKLVQTALHSKKDDSVKSKGLFQDNNAIENKTPVKPYITTRIKTRNYLPNVVYNGVVQEDFYNRNFVFEIYVLITKILSHFSIEQKIADQKKHEMR